ncbi:hypothetical protein pb186bvf_017871, partial [Paramecium bursaria]
MDIYIIILQEGYKQLLIFIKPKLKDIQIDNHQSMQYDYSFLGLETQYYLEINDYFYLCFKLGEFGQFQGNGMSRIYQNQ